MMNISELLLEYRNSKDAKILVKKQLFDKENLDVIVIEILAWLKLEHKREIWIEQGRKTKLKSMILKYEYPWCTELKEYVESEPTFREIFCINGALLDFRSDVSDDYKKEARLRAYDGYHPEMIIG